MGATSGLTLACTGTLFPSRRVRVNSCAASQAPPRAELRRRLPIGRQDVLAQSATDHGLQRSAKHISETLIGVNNRAIRE